MSQKVAKRASGSRSVSHKEPLMSVIKGIIMYIGVMFTNTNK